MPTYANPYSYVSPLGQALGKLGQTLTSGPSEAQRIKAAEEALGLKREREGITRVADLFAQHGSDAFDRNAVMSAGIMGGIDPADISGYDLYGTANRFGADSRATDAAARGAGKAFSSTAQAFNIDQGNQNMRAANALAEDARQFNMTPVETMVGGQPVFTPREGVFAEGVAPMVSETDAKGQAFRDLMPDQQSSILRGTPSRAKMYRSPDGTVGRTSDDLTDLVTGAPIPPDAVVGTISDTSDSFGNTELAKQRTTIVDRRSGVESMIQHATAIDGMLARADAGTAVGVLGTGARVINDIAAQTQAALELAGVDAPAMLREPLAYQNTFRELGVENAQIQSAIVDLAYAVAQSREPGRLTEADIDRSIRTIGGNLQDPVAMRRVLRAAVDRAITDYNAFDTTVRNVYGDALRVPPAAFEGLPPVEESAGPPRVTNEAEYNALPPGAEYMHPDGTIRTKRGR